MKSKGQLRIERLRERDGDNCCYCGGVMKFDGAFNDRNAASIEHIIPDTRGGSNKMFNLALAHRHCNIKRGDRPLKREAKVAALLADERLFCHDCLASMPDHEALTLHRLEAHGMLSTRWIVQPPAWPADVLVPLKPMCRAMHYVY